VHFVQIHIRRGHCGKVQPIKESHARALVINEDHCGIVLRVKICARCSKDCWFDLHGSNLRTTNQRFA
jgi:hypothetical protein